MTPFSRITDAVIAAVRSRLRRWYTLPDTAECCGRAAAPNIVTAVGAGSPWRLAESLKALRTQIDAAVPGRRNASDGSVGDARHASRASDHNPWVRDGRTGVVTALDITHDPDRGCDAQRLAEALIAARDRRIKYVIWNRRIASSAAVAGQPAWRWRAYAGANPHTSHIHISVHPQKGLYDDRRPWPIPELGMAADRAPRHIAWGAKVDAAFRNATIEICARLGADPDHLMAVIAFETGRRFRPDVINRASGATGLIQFMPKTAKALGTSTAALAGMDAVTQLSFVEAYLRPYKGRLGSVSDLYMAVLWPAAIGKAEDHVLFAQGTAAYRMNRGLDRNGNGKVTKAEAAARVERELVEGRLAPNLG